MPNAYFRGDADGLVDALVAASEAAWAPKAGYTGFGRELTPWCPDEDTTGLCEALEAPRCVLRPCAARGTGRAVAAVLGPASPRAAA